MDAWFVYFLQSGINGDIYVGSTSDVVERYRQHNNGEVQSTKATKPWELKGFIVVPSKEVARELEQYFKTGSGKAILKKRFITQESIEIEF